MRWEGVYAYHATFMTDAPLRTPEEGWLERFHRGDAATLEDCYREHFEAVDASVARLLRGADRETVVHEVFLKLLSNPEARRGFVGGSFAAWITTVARHQAADYLRRHRRDVSLDEAGVVLGEPSDRFEEAAEARMVVEKFLEECLPEKWHAVFKARFLEGRDPRDAAAQLGMARTTLAYQELRIRSLLERFLLRGERT